MTTNPNFGREIDPWALSDAGIVRQQRGATWPPMLEEGAPIGAQATTGRMDLDRLDRVTNARNGASEGAEDAPEWTATDALTWRQWLRDQVAQAGYLTTLPDGGPAVYYTTLAQTSTLSVSRWRAYLAAGVQPTAAHATAIARTLGMHPLAVAQRAGLLTRPEVAAALASDKLPAPSEVAAAIEQMQNAVHVMYGPAGRAVWVEDVLAVLHQTYDYLAWLQTTFHLDARDFGARAAAVLRVEADESLDGLGATRPLLRLPAPMTPDPELPVRHGQAYVDATTTPTAPLGQPGPSQVRPSMLYGVRPARLTNVDPTDVGEDTDADDEAPTIAVPAVPVAQAQVEGVTEHARK